MTSTFLLVPVILLLPPSVVCLTEIALDTNLRHNNFSYYGTHKSTVSSTTNRQDGGGALW